jgi:hypothetical protein
VRSITAEFANALLLWQRCGNKIASSGRLNLPMKATAARTDTAANPPPRLRSRVTNGKNLFVVGKATSAAARRFADILGAVVSDLGGADQLSEGQRQLARRAASLSLACERLEAVICNGVSSAAEAAVVEQSGGLSAYHILAEAGRVLHGIARVRGRDGIAEMAKLPDVELDRITDLLVKAGDLAAKAIAAGSEKTADLELLGTLADRCGRTFMRLGLKRQPRDVSPSLADLLRQDLVEQRVAEGAEGYPEAAGDEDRTDELHEPAEGHPSDGETAQ